MMPSAQPDSSGVDAAVRDVEQACRFLLHPTAERLEAAVAGLGAAIERLKDIPTAQISPALRSSAVRLNGSVRRARRLLDSGAAFHRGVSELLGLVPAAYGRDGQAPEFAPARTGSTIRTRG